MPVRVLLAEDNEALCRMLETFLGSLRFEVETAPTGTAAVELLSRHDFDLLLLDLRLPGVSGVEILQKLRATPRWASLPVIVMTGFYKEDRHIAAARRLGVRHYLLKPFSREEFLSAIQSTVAELKPKEEMLLPLLVDIFRRRRTGVITLANCSPVAVVAGEPCSLLARGRTDFPSFLQGRGLLQAEDVQHAAASGEERLYLAQLGLLSWGELVEESRVFLHKLLVENLERPASFSETVESFESPLSPVSIPSLLYEAMRSHPVRFGGERFLQKFAAGFPSRTLLFYRYANLATMRRDDIDLLGLIDGNTPLDQIVASSGPGAATFCSFLHALGMLAVHPAPVAEAVADFPQKKLFNRPLEEGGGDETAVGFDDLVEELAQTVELAVGEDGMAAPLSSDEIGFEQVVQRDNLFIKDKNYYEVFGLTPASFTFEALKDAYFAKSRQYSPEKFMELSGATQAMAQEVLAAFANAYNTLSSVVSKERYDEMLNADKVVGLSGKQDDRLQARIQFQSGKVFLEMGEVENAEKSLQDAYRLEPENAMHCAYLAWAMYQNPANKGSRTAVEKARNLLSRSLQLEKSADAFAFRGCMLLDEGRDGLAEGEFQKALKLNANESHARRGLRVIEEKREAQNKGFFRKLFT